MANSRWQHDVFFQYPLNAFPTSQGPVDLPILYYDASVFMTSYLVRASRAELELPDELEAVRVADNKWLVTVAFYQYRHTAIGPYNEVGIAVFVKPKAIPTPRFPLCDLLRPLDKAVCGHYILDLPVTTPAACAAGKEIWGYPKFVTPIDFSLEGRAFRGAVADPDGGGSIVMLEGSVGPSIPGPLIDLVLYSKREAQLLRTLVNTRGGGQWCTSGNAQLKVSPDSGHPMAERARRLGLDGMKPVWACRSHHLQLRLNAGAPLPRTAG